MGYMKNVVSVYFLCIIFKWRFLKLPMYYLFLEWYVHWGHKRMSCWWWALQPWGCSFSFPCPDVHPIWNRALEGWLYDVPHVLHSNRLHPPRMPFWIFKNVKLFFNFDRRTRGNHKVTILYVLLSINIADLCPEKSIFIFPTLLRQSASLFGHKIVCRQNSRLKYSPLSKT